MTRTILFAALWSLAASMGFAQEPVAPVESASPQPATETKVITLHHAQATEVAEVLKQVYDRGPSRIVPDARTNSVIVTGPEKQVLEFEALLLKLDEAESAAKTGIRMPRPVKHVEYTETHPVASSREDNQQLAEAVAKAMKQAGLNGNGIQIEVIDGVCALTGQWRTPEDRILGEETARNIPGIKSVQHEPIARKSPEAAPAVSAFKVFTFQHAQATEVAEVLKQVYDRGPSKIVPDARTNSVIVTGPEKQVQEIEALLLKLDEADGNARVQPKARVVPLEIAPTEGGSRLPGSVPLKVEVSEASAKELQQQLIQLRKDYEAADAQAHQLAGQLKQSPDEAKKAELSIAVQRAFTARQSLLRAELLEMQTRLLQTQRSIDLRERISDQIIQRRVEDLLHPQLEWEGETAPGQPLSQSTTPTAAKTRIHVPIDLKAALLAQLQGVWEVEVQSDDLPQEQKPNFRVIAEIRNNVMTWSLDPPQPENDKPPVFLIKLGEPGTPQPVDLVMNPNDGPKRLEMPGIIEISDDLIRICTSESQQRPEVFSVGENTDIYVLSQRAAAPAITELEGDWHLESLTVFSQESHPPMNLTVRGDQYVTISPPDDRTAHQISIDAKAGTFQLERSVVSEGSTAQITEQGTYTLRGDHLTLQTSKTITRTTRVGGEGGEERSVGIVRTWRRGHRPFPMTLPPATKDQETRWRSAIVEILVSGKPDAIQNGGQKIGFGVIVAADGTLISHMGGGWSSTIRDWPNVDARFDDGSLVPLQIVESGGSGFVILRPQQSVHLNHYFPLSEVTTGIGDEVYIGQMALTALEGGLYRMVATAGTLTQTDRRVATLGTPVWQLTSPERIPNSFCFPVLSKDGELLAITLADTGGLLLAMPVGQLKEAFPKTLGQEAAQQADTPPVPPAVPPEAPAEAVPGQP